MTLTPTLTLIKEFLKLPSEAMPQALDLDDDVVCGTWQTLRLLARGEEMSGLGSRIRLTADRDGWRDGHVITIK